MGKTTNKQMPGIMVTKVRDLAPQEREALSPENRELLEAIEAGDTMRFFEAMKTIANGPGDFNEQIDRVGSLLETLDPEQVLHDLEEADKMIDTFYSELDETDNCVYEFSPEPSEELTVEDWAILYRMVENLGHETAIEKAYTVGYLRGFKAGYTSEPGGPLS